jgi:hypothetical protein
MDLAYDNFHSSSASIEQHKIPVKPNISTTLYSEIKTETSVAVQSNKHSATFTSSSTPASYIDIHHIPVSVQGLRQHHSGPSSSCEMIQLHASQNFVANQLTSQNNLDNQESSGNIVANQQTSQNILANQQTTQDILANQQTSGNIVANQFAHGTELMQMMDANSQVCF